MGVAGLGGGVGVPEPGRSNTGVGEGDPAGVQTLTAGVTGGEGRCCSILSTEEVNTALAAGDILLTGLAMAGETVLIVDVELCG